MRLRNTSLMALNFGLYCIDLRLNRIVSQMRRWLAPYVACSSPAKLRCLAGFRTVLKARPAT